MKELNVTFEGNESAGFTNTADKDHWICPGAMSVLIGGPIRQATKISLCVTQEDVAGSKKIRIIQEKSPLSKSGNRYRVVEIGQRLTRHEKIPLKETFGTCEGVFFVSVKELS